MPWSLLHLPPLDLTTVAGRREALERQPELMAMAKERFYRDLGDIFSRSPKSNIDDAVASYLNEANQATNRLWLWL